MDNNVVEIEELQEFTPEVEDMDEPEEEVTEDSAKSGGFVIGALVGLGAAAAICGGKRLYKWAKAKVSEKKQKKSDGPDPADDAIDVDYEEYPEEVDDNNE
ncbi:MAG: hypothetical protein K6E95_07325 [Lachnospiraceae bacterium]|nr:hypothetical protein [Lachnospiraceae bacterium]